MRHAPEPPAAHGSAPLRVGSLFSGYGGLDLAVEHAFNAETIWFSEINEPVTRVFAHHWPDAPNLGDITAVDWGAVPPVDVLCGGFPCQDVSTVGKMAGLAPGTRSGLWSHMAEVIDHLRPEFVVIENVRGLLSAAAARATTTVATPEGDDHATPPSATLRYLEPEAWGVGDEPARPLRAMGAVLGDLADLGYDAKWIGLPASAVGAPHPRFRVFILARPAAAHSARIGLDQRRRITGSGAGATGHDRAQPSDHRPRPARAERLTDMAERIGDPVDADRRHLLRWGKYADAIARWEHITGREAPTPALIHESGGPRPAPVFLEWLMGLDPGWVTDPELGLTANQQMTALGNGVLPLQALSALECAIRACLLNA